MDTGWTKYIPSDKASYWSGSGSPDNKTVLDPEDDVAHVKLGGKWRIPTDVEWSELENNCTWTWTDNYNGTGVKGRIVTGKKSGYTDKSIFLPAAGYRYGDVLDEAGSYGFYLSSRRSYSDPYDARTMWLTSGSASLWGYGRYVGRSVRPVTE